MIIFVKNKQQSFIWLICFIFFAMQNNVAFAENKYNLAIVKVIEEIAEASKGGRGKVICVYGSDRVAELLIGNNSNVISFSNKTDFDKANNCKLIYFGLDRTRTIRTDLDKFQRQQIVTISTIEDFIDIGGIVELQSGRKKLDVVINSRLLAKKNIQLNQLLFEYVDNN
jgi:hypothetical protein